MKILLLNYAEGGLTPLIRFYMIYDYDLGKYPEFFAKIEELGVKYRKVAQEENDPSSALGLAWKAMYIVESKEDAEREATKQISQNLQRLYHCACHRVLW